MKVGPIVSHPFFCVVGFQSFHPISHISSLRGADWFLRVFLPGFYTGFPSRVSLPIHSRFSFPGFYELSFSVYAGLSRIFLRVFFSAFYGLSSRVFSGVSFPGVNEFSFTRLPLLKSKSANRLSSIISIHRSAHPSFLWWQFL